MAEATAAATTAWRAQAATGRASLAAFVGRALGSELRLFVQPAEQDDAALASAAPDGAAAAAWRAVLAEFDAVDRALSRFRDDSELTALNGRAGSGGVVTVSWRLREAVAAMHRAGRLTGGRFDPTVVEVLESIGEHGAAADVYAAPGPSVPDGLERARPIRVPDRAIDTGGIGKGLALRWAARRAIAVLPPTASLLLDAGGDLIAAGGQTAADRTDPPVDRPRGPEPCAWPVGIEDPLTGADPDGHPVAVVALRSGAIATSSVRVRHWRAPSGRFVHHLIDPVTRAPARTGLLSVSVVAADPAWAEVWSKALFLAGRRSIGDEARARDLAAWWVDAGGRLGMTPAARMRSTWVDEARLG